jgi:hypothetical protein
MRLSPRPRKTVSLSDSQHQRLNMYAMAASAAGVGVMAMSQPAEAKIVYTATHQVIEKHSLYNLDLNHDGKTDFTLGYRYGRVTSGTLRSIYASAPSGNGVEGTDGSRGFLAAALEGGTRIPNRLRFSRPKALMAYQCDGFIGSCRATTSFRGDWFNTTRYLGLRFEIDGQTHFGWARLSIQYNNFSFTATLTGYAYETIPDKPITAGETKGPDDAEQPAPASLKTPTGEPRTLGVLALGAPGLSIWRREDSVARRGSNGFCD